MGALEQKVAPKPNQNVIKNVAPDNLFNVFNNNPMISWNKLYSFNQKI